MNGRRTSILATKGAVKRYSRGDCPIVESMQSRLCLFKAGMQTLDKINGQVEALRATIRHYA